MSRFRWLLAALFAVAVIPAGAQAQERGTVTGTVVDKATQQPLAGAQVTITGTTLGTITNQQGRFVIPNVPTGQREVRASLIGYGAETQTVSVAAGTSATVSFALGQTAVALEEIVVTGTAGRQERRAQAAVIASVDAAELAEKAPVTGVADMLTARVPGITVISGSGTSGTSQQIRIRGASSISLSNQPLVFIDGVKADARTQQEFYVGGQGSSRLFDINPEDIESIEVVKGPAAATLYGADASAGVIQIITKKGRLGGGRFTQSITAEYNHIDPNFTPYDNYGKCSAKLVAADSPNPLCRGKQVGDIVTDNPLVREGAFRDGVLRSLAWTGRGGGEGYGYYVSLGHDGERGTLPNNGVGRSTGRVNFNFAPTDNLRIDAGFGMTRTTNDLPINDNAIYGYLGGGYLGSPLSVGTSRNGFYAPNRDVEAISSIENEQVTQRYTPSIQVNYSPASWFTNRLTVGADLSRGNIIAFFPKNDEGWYNGDTNKGSIQEARNNYDSYTVDYLGNISSAFGANLTSDLSFGFQVVSETSDVLTASGVGLVTNAARLVSAASQISAGQRFRQEKQIGFLAQEQLGWRDRLFVQLGARIDQSSSFGAESKPFFLPKVGVSYVVSEEEFWAPVAPLIGTFRVRAAWGQTGRSPTAGASLETYDPAPFAIAGGTGSGVIPLNPGNPNLRPERGTELEAGFEAGLLNDRVGVEVTYFNKKTTDLLLRQPQPPSRGVTENPFANVGEVLNTGVEFSLRGQVVQTPSFTWETRLGGSTLHNELTDLGEVEPFGTNYRFQEGYQLGALFTHRIRSVDVEKGVAVVSDTAEFAGNNLPTFEGNFANTFTIGKHLRLYGQMDWKSGFKLLNYTAFFREQYFRNDRRRVVEEALTEEQRIRRYGSFVTESGTKVPFTRVLDEFMEDASFARLREVSATLTLPTEFAQRFGASSASFTLAGRNLGLWTKYTGHDPEVVSNVEGNQFDRSDFLTVPQARRWVAKINFSF